MGRRKKIIEEDGVEAPKIIQSGSIPSLEFDDPADSLDEDEGIINDVLGPDQLYRGSKNIPKNNAEFFFTPKMIKEIKKCKRILYTSRKIISLS